MCGPALSEVMAKGRTLVGKQVLKNGCPRRVDLPRWAAQASWGKDDGEGTTLTCVGFPTGLVPSECQLLWVCTRTHGILDVLCLI